MDVVIAPSSPDEAEFLADLRVEAMRPSLEAIGRFDPVRARERFLSTFEADDTFTIRAGEQLAGFFVVRRRPDHLYLDHLYVRSDHQGLGIGRQVVERLQADARSSGLPIRLMALRDSPANAFYRARGFAFERADGVDNRYVWPGDQARSGREEKA